MQQQIGKVEEVNEFGKWRNVKVGGVVIAFPLDKAGVAPNVGDEVLINYDGKVNATTGKPWNMGQSLEVIEKPDGQQTIAEPEVNAGKPPEKVEEKPQEEKRETALTQVQTGGGSGSLFFMNKESRLRTIQGASDTAADLSQVIEKQNLYSMIGKNNPRKYVRVEGWQVLAALLGCTCEVEKTEKTESGWMAKAVVRNIDGRVLGSGEMQVNSDEQITRNDGTRMQRWSDEYMVRSMAQTRAIGKAYRNTFAWIMALAGYETTPAEEIKDEER